MKKILFVVLAALSTGNLLAQEPRPAGIEPISGEITLRYAPKYEALCTVSTYERKQGSSSGNRKYETLSTKVFSDVMGGVKLSVTNNVGSNYLRIVVRLNDDGTGFLSEDPEFETDFPIDEATKQDILRIKKLLLGALKNGSSIGAIGKPLSQGSLIDADYCGLFSLGRTQKKSGQMTVIGATDIRGRENIIVAGEQAVVCSTPGKQFGFEAKGWYALDRQSGLQADGSFVLIVSTPEGSVTATEDRQCSVSGVSAKVRRQSSVAPNASTKINPVANISALEGKLTELKRLFDAGLVSKEVYVESQNKLLETSQ